MIRFAQLAVWVIVIGVWVVFLAILLQPVYEGFAR